MLLLITLYNWVFQKLCQQCMPRTGCCPGLCQNPQIHTVCIQSNNQTQSLGTWQNVLRAQNLSFCYFLVWATDFGNAVRFPRYPSENTRDSVLGKNDFVLEFFLKVFCFCILQGQKRFAANISSEILCNSVWLNYLRFMWILCLAMQV